MLWEKEDTKSNITKIIALRKKGLSIEKIGKELGISSKSVEYFIRRELNKHFRDGNRRSGAIKMIWAGIPIKEVYERYAGSIYGLDSMDELKKCCELSGLTPEFIKMAEKRRKKLGIKTNWNKAVVLREASGRPGWKPDGMGGWLKEGKNYADYLAEKNIKYDINKR